MNPEVVKQDHELEGAATRASESLMRLRWHWTLDESNPARVAIREYARAVGRNEGTIRRDAKAGELLAGGAARTPNEAREIAGMGVETAAATEAVAAMRGVGVAQARKTRGSEVRRVREWAREKAERNGTSVEEEAPKVAEWIQKSEKAAAIQKEGRTAKLGHRYIELEGLLTKMKRDGVTALNLAREIEWGEEEQELLSDTLDGVKALLGLIDVALVGVADVDWDSELSKLTGE